MKTWDVYLAEIKARAEKASPGPWRFQEINWIECDDNTVLSASHDGNYASEVDIDDSDKHFIAHSRQDVTLLIERVEELEKALKQYSSPNDCAFQGGNLEAVKVLEKAVPSSEGVADEHN